MRFQRKIFLYITLLLIFWGHCAQAQVNSKVFLNVKRNNAVYIENQKIKKGILEIKVYGAKKGKYYRLEWLGNGTKTWGSPNYEILFSEYDQKQFGLHAESSKTDLIKLGDLPRFFLNKSQVHHRVISLPNSDISFSISYNPTVFGDYEGMNFPHQSGYGMVINPENYIYDIAAFEVKAENPNDQLVFTKGSQVSIRNKYDYNQDMQLDFDYTGANNLYSLKQILLIPNDSLRVSRNKNKPFSILSPNISDWLSPYIVRDANKDLASANPMFTGGNHDIDFQGTKLKTGKTLQVKIWTDQGNLPPDALQSAGIIYIKVTNEIAGYNTITPTTSRPVIREECLFTIRNGKVDVAMKITPLADIVIETYYGLQTINAGWNGSINYIHGQGGERVSIQGISNNSGPKSLFPAVHKFILKDKSGYHALVAWLDPEDGLGKFKYLAEQNAQAFTESYGKSYFNLINGKPTFFPAKKPITWKGGWIFTNTANTRKPADLIYTYKDLAKNLHYINLELIRPADLFLLLPPGNKSKKRPHTVPDQGALEITSRGIRVKPVKKSVQISF